MPINQILNIFWPVGKSKIYAKHSFISCAYHTQFPSISNALISLPFINYAKEEFFNTRFIILIFLTMVGSSTRLKRMSKWNTLHPRLTFTKCVMATDHQISSSSCNIGRSYLFVDCIFSSSSTYEER